MFLDTLRLSLIVLSLGPSLLFSRLRWLLTIVIDAWETPSRLARRQLELRTLLIWMAVLPPVLAVTWSLSHSLIGMAGWFAFAGFFVLIHQMLIKSQAFPHETRGSRMRLRNQVTSTPVRRRLGQRPATTPAGGQAGADWCEYPAAAGCGRELRSVEYTSWPNLRSWPKKG